MEETRTQTDPSETEADFKIRIKEEKSEQEVIDELVKHWDSDLKVYIGWDTIKINERYFIIEMKLKQGESMNNLKTENQCY